jgi:hypothetical protein
MTIGRNVQSTDWYGRARDDAAVITRTMTAAEIEDMQAGYPASLYRRRGLSRVLSPVPGPEPPAQDERARTAA